CEAIWKVIECGQVGQTYNVGGNEERTNIDVVGALCELVAQQTGRSAADVLALIRFVEGRARTLAWYIANPAWVKAVQAGEHQKWLEKNYDRRLRTANDGRTNSSIAGSSSPAARGVPCTPPRWW